MDEKSRATTVVDLGGVWKKALKRGRHKGKGYPSIIHCRKCGKRILNGTWFYVRIKGGKYPKRVYYCPDCFGRLWHE